MSRLKLHMLRPLLYVLRQNLASEEQKFACLKVDLSFFEKFSKLFEIVKIHFLQKVLKNWSSFRKTSTWCPIVFNVLRWMNKVQMTINEFTDPLWNFHNFFVFFWTLPLQVHYFILQGNGSIYFVYQIKYKFLILYIHSWSNPSKTWNCSTNTLI